MASSDTPANPDKRNEQVPAAGSFLPVNDTRNVKTVKSPPSSESANKRKRESTVDNDKSAKETTPTAADTKQTAEMKHVADVETTSVKEVEMKDAESVEIEMQDAAEVADNKPDGQTNPEIDEKETASEGGKEDEGKVGEKQQSNDEDGSGQHVLLGEVATLLKQVEESETKAKLEVEVKVKKVDHGDVKENVGQLAKQEPNPRSQG